MKTLIPFALMAGLMACSHAQVAPDAALKPAAPAPAPAAAPAAPTPAAYAKPAPQTLSGESIYFAFDEATLEPGGEQYLAKLGAILAKNPAFNVRVEGNCDERGSEEYNIALGQRRADAARKYLVRMGAQNGQISTVSYGKDRPRAPGHDEKAWRENRRDDFHTAPSAMPEQPVAANP